MYANNETRFCIQEKKHETQHAGSEERPYITATRVEDYTGLPVHTANISYCYLTLNKYQAIELKLKALYATKRKSNDILDWHTIMKEVIK